MIGFKNIWVFLFVLVFAALPLEYIQAQSSWLESTKQENKVILQQAQNVEIYFTKQGELQILSHVFEEALFNNATANMFSEQAIGYSDSFTEVNNVEAYSLVPGKKGKLQKLAVKNFNVSDDRSAGVFYDDKKKISFVYPALQKGAHTVLRYDKKYLEPRLWGYFLFADFSPVSEATYTVKVPKNVHIGYFLYGISDDKVNFSRTEKGKFYIYQWSAHQLNKILPDKGNNGILKKAAHIIIHIDSYDKDGKKHKILEDVADLYAWYSNFLNDIDKEDSPEMRDMVNSIIQGKATELEKVEAIYDWVQKNVKYIAIENGLGGFRPRSSELVFSRRYGDCKDMSNLLHNMLKMANIPSSLAWIGTTAIPYSHRDVPTPMADNHMICTYRYHDKYYFLDATDQYNQLGIPTTHIQGREALVYKSSKKFELVNVPVVAPENNRVVDSVLLTVNDNILIGRGTVSFTGYNRLPVVHNLLNLDDKDKKDYLNALLSKGNNKFMLGAVQTSHVSDKYDQVSIQYDFTINDYLVRTGNEIIINPHLSMDWKGKTIDPALESTGIHNTFKTLKDNSVFIQIPDGYRLTYLPKNAGFEDGDFGYSIKYSVEGNMIKVYQRYKMNTLDIGPDKFEKWNTMIKNLFSVYRESVVLENAEIKN